MSCYFPSGPIPLYWLRVPPKVMQELRVQGFHDGYSRERTLDADVQVVKAFSPGISLAHRDLHLKDWLTWVDREASLLSPGHPSLWHPALKPSDEEYIRRRFAYRLVEIQADTTEEALHRFRLTKWNFGIFYHVACMGHWEEVVEEQLTLLRRAGLNGVRVGMLGTPRDRERLARAAARHEIDLSIEYQHSDLGMFEIPTIRMLGDWCQYRDGYVLYFHTKGVSDPHSPFKQDWRRLMQQFVIEPWQQNAELLRAGHDAVGINWQDNPPNSHFPGNFWMATTSFVRGLKDLQEYDQRLPYLANNATDQQRLAAEFWIGSSAKPPRVYSHVAWNQAIDQTGFWEKAVKNPRGLSKGRGRLVPGAIEIGDTRESGPLSPTLSPLEGERENRRRCCLERGSNSLLQPQGGKLGYLALCLFVKDENDYLPEWLDYHLRLGVEHFFIYDNNSRRPIQKTVENYIKRGLVTVHPYAETAAGRQCRAYAQCLRDHGSEYFWIGFTDTDEFIVPTNHQALPEFLQRFEKYGGLGIFWLCFGSSGHVKKPRGGVIRSFIRRSEEGFDSNDHIKTIVNTQFAVPTPATNPHMFNYAPGYFTVDENEAPIFGPRRRPRTSRQIQLNHYIVRSREEFEAKLERGGGNSPPDQGQYAGAFWHKHEAACNAVEDRAILEVARRFKPAAGPRTASGHG